MFSRAFTSSFSARPLSTLARRIPSYSSTSSLSSSSPLVSSSCRSFTKAAPSVWGFSGKSATKLFNDASKTSSISAVSDELRAFQKAYDSHYALRVAFVNPLLKGDKRQSVLNALFPKLKITNALSKDLIKSLVETRQLGRLKKIIEDFDKLASHSRNEVFATVTSAEALSSEQQGRITEALKKRVAATEKLVLTTKVDPSILGGLKIFLDNKMLDLSAATRIKVIDRALRGKA